VKAPPEDMVVPIIVVGSGIITVILRGQSGLTADKCDLKEDRQVTEEEARTMVETWGCKYFETSAVSVFPPPSLARPPQGSLSLPPIAILSLTAWPGHNDIADEPPLMPMQRCDINVTQVFEQVVRELRVADTKKRPERDKKRKRKKGCVIL
jgi:GTPase SAR1 family protein